MWLSFIFAFTFLTPEEKKQVIGNFYDKKDLEKNFQDLKLVKEKRFLPKKDFYFYHPYYENPWELSNRLFGEGYLKEFSLLFKAQYPFEFSVEYTNFLQKFQKDALDVPSFLFFEKPPVSLLSLQLKNSKIEVKDSHLQGIFHLIHPLDNHFYKTVAQVHLHDNHLQVLKEFDELKEPLILINYQDFPFKPIFNQEGILKKKYPHDSSFKEDDLLAFTGHYSPHQRLCLFNKEQQCQGEVEVLSSHNNYTITKIIKICPNDHDHLIVKPSLIPVSSKVQEYCTHGCVKIPPQTQIVPNPVNSSKKLILENRPMDYATKVLVETDLEKYEDQNREDKYYSAVSIETYEEDLGKLYIDPPAIIEDNPYGLTPSVVEEALELINRDS